MAYQKKLYNCPVVEVVRLVTESGLLEGSWAANSSSSSSITGTRDGQFGTAEEW